MVRLKESTSWFLPLAALAAAFGLWSASASAADAKPARIVGSLQGRDCVVRETTLMVVNTPDEWARAMRTCFGDKKPFAELKLFGEDGKEGSDAALLSAFTDRREPPLDLGAYTALFVFPGRAPSGAPWLEVKSVTERDDALLVTFAIVQPEEVRKAIMDPAPFAILFVPKTSKPVEFEGTRIVRTPHGEVAPGIAHIVQEDEKVHATVGRGSGDVVNGLQLQFKATPAAWEADTDVRLFCTVCNATEKPIRVPAWGLDADRVLEISDTLGRVTPGSGLYRKRTRELQADDFAIIAGGESKCFELQGRFVSQRGKDGRPERMLTVSELRGGGWSWPLSDGQSLVRAVFDIPDAKAWGADAPAGLWTGQVLSNRATVLIGANTPAAPADKAVGGAERARVDAPDPAAVRRMDIKPPDAAQAWGEAVNSLAVSLEIPLASWQSGDQVLFRCTVKNVSDKPMRVPTWGLEAWQVLECTDAAGKVFYNPGFVRTASIVAHAGFFTLLAPGESKTFENGGLFQVRDGKLMLGLGEPQGGSCWWTLPEGALTFRAIFEAGEKKDWVRLAGGEVWKGKAFSNAAQVSTSKETRPWGEAVNGIELSLDLKQTSWMPGTKIEFGLFVRNVSDKPIRVPAWGINTAQVLELTGPDGKTLPNMGAAVKHARMVTPADFAVLAPGETKRFTLSGSFDALTLAFGTRYLSVNEPTGGVHGWRMDKGQWRVRAILDFQADKELSKIAGGELWTGKAFSNPAKVSIVERDPAGSAALTMADPVDAVRLEKAEVVVRGTCVRIPAGPGKGGWPQFTLTVSRVFKAAPNADLKAGGTLTLIALDAPAKEATFYLRKETAYPPGYYRLMNNAAADISHVGDQAATTAAKAEAPVVKEADAWGEPSDGLKVALEIGPAKWSPGTPVGFVLVVLNVSDKPITSSWGLAIGQELELTAPDGTVVAKGGGRNGMEMMPANAIQTIAPGEAKRFTVTGQITEQKMLIVRDPLGDVTHWQLADGVYSARIVVDRTGSERARKIQEDKGYWTGKVSSGSVKVTMGKAADDAAERTPAHVELEAPAPTPGETVNGLKLTISALQTVVPMKARQLRSSTEKTPRQDAGPVTFTATFTNMSKEPIKLDAHALGRRLLTFDIAGPNAKSVVQGALQKEVKEEEAKASDFPTIEPFQSWSWRTTVSFPSDFCGSFFALQEPGDYRFTAVYSKTDDEVKPGFWTGAVASKDVVVHFGEPPAKPMVDLTPIPGAAVKGLKLALSTDRTLLTIKGPGPSSVDAPPRAPRSALSLTFTNVSDKPIKLDAYDIRFSRLALNVRCQDSKSVRISQIRQLREMPAPAEADYPTLAPGKSWSCPGSLVFPGMFGEKEYALLNPDVYTIEAVYSVPEENDRSTPLQQDRWSGLVTSNAVSFVAGPPGEPVNGLKMKISVDTTDLRMTPHVSVTFTNVSEEPVIVDAFDLAWSRLQFHIDGPPGGLRVTLRPIERSMRAPIASDYHTLEPDQSWTFERAIQFPGDVGAFTYALTAPGDYRLNVSYSRWAYEGARSASPLARNAWTGTVVSNEIVLHRPGGDEKAAPAKVELAAAADKAPEAGEAVNGLKLTVSVDKLQLKMTPRDLLRASKDTPRWNVEPAKLSFTFTNVSDKPIKVDVFDLAWSRLRLEVKGPDAESVRVLKRQMLRKPAQATEADFPTIAPGKSWTSDVQALFPGMFGDSEYILLKPGEYRLKVAYNVPLPMPASAVERRPAYEEGYWRGTVASSEVVLMAVVEEAKPEAATVIVGPDANVAEDPADKPGDAVMGLKLTLTADRTEMKMKAREYRRAAEDSPRYSVEPVKLTFMFTNVSDKPIKLDAYDIIWSRMKLDVKGPDAGSVKIEKRPIDREMKAPREMDYPEIAPGKTWSCAATFPGMFGEKEYIFQKTGEYRVSVSYSVLSRALDTQLEGGRWHGKVTSNEIVLKGVEAEAKPAAATQAKAAAGESVNGLKLTLTADATELKMTPRELLRAGPDTPRWNVEPAKLTFTFTNVSDKPLKLDTYLLAWTRLDVHGPAAGSVRTRDWGPSMGAPAPPTEKAYPTIDPGKSWDIVIPFPGMFGTNEYTLMQPGEYRVKVTYSVPVATKDRIALLEQGRWAGSVTSNEIVLKGVEVEAKPAAATMIVGPDANVAEDAAPKPGEPVNGLKLTIAADAAELKMKPRTYLRASKNSPRYWITPVKLTFTFTNVADKPVKLDVYDFLWSKVRPDVKGPNAESVLVLPVPVDRKMAPPTEKDYKTIEPGKSYTYEWQPTFPGEFGYFIYILQSVGEYRIKATYGVPELNDLRNASPIRKGIWTGTVTSNEIVLKGVEVDEVPAPTGAAPAADKAPEPKPGEAVKGLKLTLKADKTELKMTPRSYRRAALDSPRWWVEQTKLSFTFTNVSDKPIKIDAYDLDWSRLKVDVTGPDGESVRIDAQPINRQMAAPTEEDYPTFAPGESSTHKNRPLFPGVFAGNNYIFLKPGEYRVKVTYNVPGPVPATAVQRKEPFQEGVWEGTVVSNEIVLTATLPPGEKADAPAPAETTTGHSPAGYKLGDPVNGLKLTLSAEKAEFKMTPKNLRRATKDTPRWDVEPVNLVFTFTNVSDAPIKVNVYDLIEMKMPLTVIGPNGDSVQKVFLDGAAAMAHIPAGPAFFPVIEPGKSYTCDVKAPFPGDFFHQRIILMEPGEYKVRALYDNGAKILPGDTPLERGVWIGRVVSNEIVLKGVGVGELPRLEDAAAPGKAVKGLKLELDADKTELKMTPLTPREALGTDGDRYLAETARMTLTFTNVSDKPIKLDAYDLPWRLLELDAEGPDAGSVYHGPVRAMRQLVAPAAKDYPTIEPGKSWSRVVSLPGAFSDKEYRLRKPGEFKVKVLYVVPEEKGADGKDPFKTGSWTGTVASNEIKLTGIAVGEEAAAFPLTDEQVKGIILKAVKESKEPPNRMIRAMAPQVEPLVSKSDATGGAVPIANPLRNSVFRCVTLGYGPAAPARVYACVGSDGGIIYPFKIADFPARLAKEDASKWTDETYLDAAKLYVHLATLASQDGWCVLKKPQDFMDITFNMRKDEPGVKQRQGAADRITPVDIRRAPDKVAVKFWAWHNIQGRLVQWTVEFGKTFAGTPAEIARFGGGGYD